jgi:hypothetical protein
VLFLYVFDLASFSETRAWSASTDSPACCRPAGMKVVDELAVAVAADGRRISFVPKTRSLA